jgi:uncharacterized glyoxalase superfamily protein PhnB
VALDNDTALQAHSIIPSLTADDLQASIGFYEGLGFGVEQRWEEQGVLQGVMLIAGNTRIGLTQDDWKKGRDRVKGQGTRLFIGTNQDLDALAARAKAAGIALDSEPHDTPWGTRSFDLTDPTGFKITVEQE